MRELLLLKYGEIVLKGENKSSFEAMLVKRIKESVRRYGDFVITRAQSTIRVEPAPGAECDLDGAERAVGKIFGVAAYSRCAAVEKDIEVIKEKTIEYLRDELESAKSFKVESKRSDKTFRYNSIELSKIVADEIFLQINGVDDYDGVSPVKLKADVKNPELTVFVEIREEYAYIHADQRKGAGGMPVGSNGRGMLLLSGGIDSPVAGYMMAKRGLAISAIHFDSFPYTSERALEKVESLADIISAYCGDIYMNIVSLTKIQEEIKKNCRESYFTLLLRRSMMRIASAFASRYRCGCLITGESLGQVASQTLEALNVTDDSATIPVFRPCIGMDKNEIVEISRKIGAFETSIEPYEDCCTVFTPRHPTTKPALDKIVEEEKKYDWKTLEAEAIKNARTRFPDGSITEGEQE